MQILSSIARHLWRPVLALAVLVVGLVATAVPALAADAAAVAMQVPDGFARIIDLIDRFLDIAALAPLVIPLTELRKLVGGLPDLPLPNGRKVRAGRWVSWSASGILVGVGHYLGWLEPFTAAENLQLWWTVEWAGLALIANYVYDRFFAPPEIIELEATSVR